MIIRIGPAAFVVFLLAAASAHGQGYRCGSGRAAHYSDRPCGTSSTDTVLGAYGPSRAAPSYTQQLPGAPRMQEHVKYLGSGCASISEAIRTAPARGVRSDVISGLQEEYHQKCSIEDQDARNQLRQEKSLQVQAGLAQRDGAINERKQAKVKSEQCAGMRDVIALKRKREKELNEKEVAALRDLERAYNDRCLAS